MALSALLPAADMIDGAVCSAPGGRHDPWRCLCSAPGQANKPNAFVRSGWCWSRLLLHFPEAMSTAHGPFSVRNRAHPGLTCSNENRKKMKNEKEKREAEE
jgi:hypothetical protein